jgi:hypothetical protein
LRVGLLGIEVQDILHAGDVLGIHLRNAPHLLAPRLEIVLDQASANRLARQALVRGQLDHLTRQQLQRPARPARRRPGAGGRHQQGFLLAGQLALCAGPPFLAQRPLQTAFDEPPLDPVHRRAADPDTGGNLVVADPRVSGQQDLRPL